MNTRNTTVTNGPWNYGGDYSSEGNFITPFRLREGKLFRDGKFRVQEGDFYRFRLPDGLGYDERQRLSDEIGLRQGYIKQYSRNTCKFVMSRAARKRGYKSTDSLYLWRVERAGR